jgi:hypothetical protein
VEKICKSLYSFCKKNIGYKEEDTAFQTTAIPTGILTRGEGDCKHFSSFCGGILDAINRLTGKKIKWWYRFASYNALDSTPHHVFVVVLHNKEELWIDATPYSEITEPFWQQDEKISSMALYRNIASVKPPTNAVGLTSIVVSPKTDGPGNLLFHGATVEGVILKGMWPKYLGLTDYRDMSGDRSINEWGVADALNKLIASGPHPGHTVTGDFVKWVYDESVRSWNFYYPNGAEPDFNGKYWIDKYQAGMNETGWPYLIITPDGRLTIDHDVLLDDYRNAGIHIMTAWAQSLVNKYDTSTYPVKPRHLKEFSQNYTGNPGNPNANLFTEARGTSFLTDIGKAIEDGINWVKDGILKVVGFIPRQAFLGLVGLNVFHMATDLAYHIQHGSWEEISNKWKNLGGNPDKLHSTIEHGAGQVAIEDMTQNADVSISGAGIGVVQVAAIIAAASPIIMALLKFLNRDGKLNSAIGATQTILQAQYPDVDWSFLSGALTANGTPVQFIGDPDPLNGGSGGTTATNFLEFIKRNPLPVAAVATAGTYFIVNKKGKKPNYIIPVAVGGGIFLLIKYALNSNTKLSSATKRAQLINYINALQESQELKDHYITVFSEMTDGEINLVYEWIFSYVKKSIPLPTEGTLYNEMVLLDQKYGLFGT